jgi:hypothetical protein
MRIISSSHYLIIALPSVLDKEHDTVEQETLQSRDNFVQEKELHCRNET